jgi:membrane-bound ClpP family serine protease
MMAIKLLLYVLLAAALLLPAIVIVVSRHRKSGARQLRLTGATGLVNTRLGPEGSVIVDGELWRARLRGGGVLDPKSRVSVVDFDGPFLLVKPLR